MKVLIIGGGIGGLSLALALHQAKVPCHIYEATSELKELGVGINVLPHAVGYLESLGVADALLARGIETHEICFYTAHGQFVDRDLRGRFGGHASPQISAHRADLHSVLLEAVRERLGEGAITLGHRCIAIHQNDLSATAEFVDPNGKGLPSASGSVAIGCDGIHSVVRRTLHPGENQTQSYGTTQYRGVTMWKPFLTGASMVYVGTHETGKLVCYPIRPTPDAEGRVLTNWVVEINKSGSQRADWDRTASADAFIDKLESWTFDWLDVPAMIRAAQTILEYPVVDRDPLRSWTDRRVTLLGDAAHPMLPRGSNGAAHAMLDGRALANALTTSDDPSEALFRYEEERRPATSRVVLANRDASPDAILRVVQQRTNGAPFDAIDQVISPHEREEWQSRYRAAAGFQKVAT
jgi:2-polyprenyl-6-methoxyphenol hydroxylase-like FAD-dependent oxidoreductase